MAFIFKINPGRVILLFLCSLFSFPGKHIFAPPDSKQSDIYTYKNIKSEWLEIVRVMNTQKCIITIVQNTSEQWISVRKCSEPEDKAIRICDALRYKYTPFIRKKSVVHKPLIKKMKWFKIINL